MTAVIAFVVGFGGVGLGVLLARRNEQQSRAEDLLTQALNDAVAAIAEVASGGGPNAQAHYASLTQLAADCGLITPLTVSAIEGVTVMHNLAVHGPHRDITTKQVDEYIVLIQGVIYAIQQNIRRYQAEHLADRT